MFTVKLYRDASDEKTGLVSRSRIATAEYLTVIDESRYLKGVTLHRRDPMDDEVYYVGTITDTTSYADVHRTYDQAIVENAAGKTTEIIRPRSAYIESADLRSSLAGLVA